MAAVLEPRSVRALTMGLAVSAIGVASFALWQVRRVDEQIGRLRASAALDAGAARPAARGAASDESASLARDLKVMHRIDDLERKLSLIVAKAEGRLPPSDDRHDSERKLIVDELAILRVEIDSLALAVSRPMRGEPEQVASAAAELDAGAGAAIDDNALDDDALDDDEPDAGAAEEPAPEPVTREALLTSVRDQALQESVGEFARIVGLDDAQRGRVEDIVRARRDEHADVIREVTDGSLSVRDASIRLERANAEARNSLHSTVGGDQAQKFQSILSRLDALWWHF